VILTLRLIRLANAACGFMQSRSYCIISAEQISRASAARARYRLAWRRRVNQARPADVQTTEESPKLLAALLKPLLSFDEVVLDVGKAGGRWFHYCRAPNCILTPFKQVCCGVPARVYAHDSRSGRATWLVGFPANLPFGRIGRVVCVARSNASAIEWPREFRQQCVVGA
jgi:hypothetical protein